jgi:membrane protease YdiL (CAAX protease family)
MIVAETTSASAAQSPIWLLIVVGACVPVTIVALVRIGRWWLSGAPVPPPLDEALPAVPWPPAFGAALFAFLVFCMFFIQGLYAVGKRDGLWPWEPLAVPDMFGPGMFLAQAVPPLVGLAAVRFFGRGAAATAGVRKGPLVRGLLAGVVALAVALPLCLAALKINVILVLVLGYRPELHPVLEKIGEQPTGVVLALAILQAGVMAPLAEEFIYRGVLMMSLLKQAGIGGALAVSSAVFALAHLPAEPQAVLPLFVLALALGYVAYRTRSLVGPIIGHSLFNTLMVLSAFAAR